MAHAIMIEQLRRMYTDAAIGIVRRNQRRGQMRLANAISEAAHVFALAGVVNVLTLITLLGQILRFSRLSLILCAVITYVPIHRLHCWAIRKRLVDPDGELHGGDGGTPAGIIAAFVYVLGSVAALALAAILVGKYGEAF